MALFYRWWQIKLRRRKKEEDEELRRQLAEAEKAMERWFRFIDGGILLKADLQTILDHACGKGEEAAQELKFNLRTTPEIIRDWAYKPDEQDKETSGPEY